MWHKGFREVVPAVLAGVGGERAVLEAEAEAALKTLCPRCRELRPVQDFDESKAIIAPHGRREIGFGVGHTERIVVCAACVEDHPRVQRELELLAQRQRSAKNAARSRWRHHRKSPRAV